MGRVNFRGFQVQETRNACQSYKLGSQQLSWLHSLLYRINQNNLLTKKKESPAVSYSILHMCLVVSNQMDITHPYCCWNNRDIAGLPVELDLFFSRIKALLDSYKCGISISYRKQTSWVIIWEPDPTAVKYSMASDNEIDKHLSGKPLLQVILPENREMD